MTAETIAIEYQVKNAAAFIRSAKDSEKALRDEAKALELSVRELQKEILEKKKAGKAGQDYIRATQLEIQALRLNAAEKRNQAAAMQEQAKAAQQALKPTENLTKAFASQTTVMLSTTAAIAGIGYGLSKAINEFGNFERTLNTIKAVSGATAGEMESIKKSALDLGASTIFSNQQVADSYLGLARAGFTTQDSLASMPGLLSLAAASGDSLGQSAEITAGILRGFNLNASEAGRVADVLAQAANVSAGEIGDFGAALKQLAPVALSSNQSLEELAGELAILSNRMINGADAGTDLKAILLRLVRPDTQKELKALGLQVTDTENRIKPLVQIIGEFKERFKDLNQAGQLEVAGKIAGIENVKSLLTLINTDKAELDEFINKMKSAEGAAASMAETINQGVNTSVEEFGGAIETLSSKLGEKLAPAFNGVVQAATNFIAALGNNDALQSFTIGAAAAVTGAASLVATIKLLPAAFQAAQTASLALSAALGISTGGLTWVIGGLVAAGGTLGVLYQKMEQDQRRFKETTLELRGEIDRLTDSQAQESLKTIKLAKEYDELAKKKNLTKGESQRLADIVDSLVTTMGIEGESVDQLTKKYGSLAAAIREKTVASLAEKRQEALNDKLKQTQSDRKQAGIDLRSAQNAEGDFFRQIYGPDGKLLTGKARSKFLKDQTRKAKAALERVSRKEEFEKDAILNVLDDTRKIIEGVENPAKNAAPGNFGTQNAPSTEKTKKGRNARGRSAESLEQRAIRNIMREQSVFNENLNATAALANADLGAEPTFVQQTRIETIKLAEAKKKLEETQQRLNALNPKTEQGLELQSLALESVRAELTQNKVATKELQNEQERFDKAIRNRERDFLSGLQVGNTQAELNQLAENIEQRNQELDALYERGQISAEEYYGTLAERSQFYSDAEIKALEIRIEAINKIKEELTPLEIQQGRLLELTAQENDLVGQIVAKRKQQQTEQSTLTVQLTKTLEATGKRLGDSFEQQLSNAIQSALTGGGALGAIKQFAKAFGSSILAELASGLAKNIRLAVDPFMQALGQGINRLFGRQGEATTASGSGGLNQGLNLSKGKLAIAGLGLGVAAGGRAVASNSKGAGGKIAGAAMGALGGAATGAMLGSVVPGIGTAIGAVAGAIIGGVSAMFGGGGKKKQALWEANGQRNADFANKILNGADQNNIIDLTNRRNLLMAKWRKQEKAGKGGKQQLKDAADQLKAAIKAREKSINEALKEFEKQNKDLADQVALGDAKPFEKAAIERRIAIRQIEFDTAKLLDQFKDSEKAKTAILEQDSLKRQLLQQQENNAAKDSVETLADLLKQRDEAANANVFQRAKSAEQVKRETIANLDKGIAEAFLKLQGQLAAGATPGPTAGLNQILEQVERLKVNGGNATLNVYIDEANNPALVQEAVTRAFNSFTLKVFGANVY